MRHTRKFIGARMFGAAPSPYQRERAGNFEDSTITLAAPR